ncbi:hypothetical protein LINPERPRIM_LOCUS6235 [Linum perenne]
MRGVVGHRASWPCCIWSDNEGVMGEGTVRPSSGWSYPRSCYHLRTGVHLGSRGRRTTG